MIITRTITVFVAAALLAASCESYWGKLDNPMDPRSEAWVEPTPVIEPASLRIAANPGSTAAIFLDVRVDNGGEGVLEVGIAGGASWLSIGGSGWIAPMHLYVGVHTMDLSLGSHQCDTRVTYVSAQASGEAFVLLPLTVDIVDGPLVAVTENALWFFAPSAGVDPAPQTVSVTNGGEGVLGDLSVSNDAGGWLDVSLDVGTAPATLTVSPHAGALAAGKYLARVTVTAAGAANSPLEMPLWFTIP